MSEPEPLAAGPRIQFGDDVHFAERFGDAITSDPVKSSATTGASFSVYSAGIRAPSVADAEKTRDVELEERAVQIADADLNTKKKQVSTRIPSTYLRRDTDTHRHTQGGCLFGLRINRPESSMATLEPPLSTSSHLHSQASHLTMTWSARYLLSFGP